MPVERHEAMAAKAERTRRARAMVDAELAERVTKRLDRGEPELSGVPAPAAEPGLARDTVVERWLAAGPRAAPAYEAVPVGRFHNLDRLWLQWVAPDLFELFPDPARPFRFERASGEIIEPRHFFTNGGTIPALAEVLLKGLSPWGYGLAYIVHDWEFELKYCQQQSKSFEDVRDTMAEALKTMMEQAIGGCRKDSLAYRAIVAGINSPVARRLWDDPAAECSLPTPPVA